MRRSARNLWRDGNSSKFVRARHRRTSICSIPRWAAHSMMHHARKLCAAVLQIVIGDGLSVPAIGAQVPRLLPLLVEGAGARGWSVGQTFIIHHCRVGIVNEIGELLRPRVVLLLIGERPGLGTAESLSAYMAYQPQRTHTDANRNLISNIHGRGLSADEAAARILNLCAQMISLRISGVALKESAGHEPESLPK